MSDGSQVSIELVAPHESACLVNLMQLYLHDMSEIFPIEIDAAGRFEYEHLARYWSEPARRFPFFIRAGGRLVGFALVTAGSPASDDPAAFDVAEFFVLRRARRSGVGRHAAFALWNRFAGPWTVRVSQANRPGLPFWTRTVAEYTHGALSESTRPGSAAPVQVFAFTSAASR